MNVIEKQYQKIKDEHRLGLMTHVVVGYPDLRATREMVKMMAASGVDFVELQIPFSDPIGDGPVIREASTQALAKGVRVNDAFALARQLVQEDHVSAPLLFMTYFNIVFAYGLEQFCADAAATGIAGLIIPDYNLDMEAHEHFDALCRQYNLTLVRFASFDSDEKRLRMHARDAAGFIYCFSTRGVTGTRDQLDPYLVEHLARLHGIFSQPLAVGFGVSSGEQVRALKGHADIVVVGSALVKELNMGGMAKVMEKIHELVVAL